MKKLLINLLILVSSNLILTALAPGLANAVNVIDPVCQTTPSADVCKDDQASATNEDNPILGPNGLITKAMQILVVLIGIASVVAIMISGVKYVTSGGEAESTNSAKRGIIYAVAGLIIALTAQAIVSFVLRRL